MTTDWIDDTTWSKIKAHLMPANALALEVSERYGLRISDVLSLTREQVERGDIIVREHKTGKSKRIRICDTLRRRLLNGSGVKYVFEGRNRSDRSRTRQAVWADIRRTCQRIGIKGCIGCHTARKIYAVRRYNRYGLKGVQHLLNHDNVGTTAIYALSDKMSPSKKAK